MQSILVVDDDSKIARIVSKYLTAAGHQVGNAETAAMATAELCSRSYKLAVLDVMLPDSSGLELCARLRSSAGWATAADIPVLMLSALGLTDDVVRGLRRGADDYLIKPFEPRELVERVAALLRRYRSGEQPSRQLIGQLELDRSGETCCYQGRPVDLTRREYALLAYLCDHPGRVFKRQQLLDAVWGLDYLGSDRAVDLCVLRLRQKLQALEVDGVSIETVWGSGYKLLRQES